MTRFFLGFLLAIVGTISILVGDVRSEIIACPDGYENLLNCEGKTRTTATVTIRAIVQLCEKDGELFLGILDSGMHNENPVLNDVVEETNGDGVTTYRSKYSSNNLISGVLTIAEDSGDSFKKGTFSNGEFLSEPGIYQADIQCVDFRE